jgi:nitrogen PTS system EIIA component
VFRKCIQIGRLHVQSACTVQKWGMSPQPLTSAGDVRMETAMIENLLSEHDIALNIIAKGKRPALTKISVGLAQRAGITEKTILSGLLAREKVGSTALGKGIAVPHVLLNNLSHPVASLTRLSAPIDFDAPDDSQVDLLFALLWPRRDTQQFLPTLASVSRMFRSKFLREALREARSPAEAYAIMCLEPMRFTMAAHSKIPRNTRAAIPTQ